MYVCMYVCVHVCMQEIRLFEKDRNIIRLPNLLEFHVDIMYHQEIGRVAEGSLDPSIWDRMVTNSLASTPLWLL